MRSRSLYFCDEVEEICINVAMGETGFIFIRRLSSLERSNKL